MEICTHTVNERSATLLLESIPSARIQIYKDIAGSGDDVLAAELYLWNSYMAATVQRATGIVEVLLRNLINDAFSDWNSRCPQNGTRNWITSPIGKLQRIVFPSGGKSLKKHAHTNTVEGEPTHDDLVAGLPFGSWTQLLPHKGRQSAENPRYVLWKEALEPVLHQANETSFPQRARDLAFMRNRASHHRPLLSNLSKIEKTHQDCVEVATAINPGMGSWMRSEKWIPQALKLFPGKH